jgi:uncharacterized membrane protein
MGFCLLAYVVLVHLSIILDRPLLAGAALIVLGAAFLSGGLKARRPLAWLALLAVAIVSVWTVRQGVILYALYLPPILLPVAMLYWWGGSLRAGQTPFVTRIATVIRGPLPPDYARYTRAVTQLWVGVFALLAAAGAGLALWAAGALAKIGMPPALVHGTSPAEIWSLFTNFLNTLFIGLVFLFEYLYRRLRFRHLEHPGFVSFIRQVAKAGVRRPAPADTGARRPA